MTNVPEKTAAPAPGVDAPFLIDSCHNTWEFDPVGHRYRRHVKAPGSTTRAATDWTPYWGVIFDQDSESFVVLLNESGTRILRSYSHSPGCNECAEHRTEEVDLAAIRRRSHSA